MKTKNLATHPLAGVIGWPVAHSRSPALHRHWLGKLGLGGEYVRLPVKPGAMREALSGLRALGFAGANVTVPHKQTALRLADLADDVAARIGAANTLVVLEDGRIEARNTDAFGFLAHLAASCPERDPSDGPAVVLGAGGAARAVAVALSEAGCPEVRLLNRTLSRATELAADIRGAVRALPWAEVPHALADAALLVNTTSLGMEGQPPLEIDLAPIPDQSVVYDIVYTPLETALLAEARARGLAVVDGLGMLIHQAVPAFEAFFGVLPPVDGSERAVLLGSGAG